MMMHSLSLDFRASHRSHAPLRFAQGRGVDEASTLHKPDGNLCSLQSYRHDVRTGAKDRRFALHFSDGGQQALALNWVSPETIKIASQPARAFDRQYLEDLKPGGLDFARQFAGTMKESVGKIQRVPCGIPVLAILQVAIEDGSKLRIVEKSVSERVEQRREVTDAYTPDQPSSTQHAVCLEQARDAIFPFDQMIKGTEKEHCVG